MHIWQLLQPAINADKNLVILAVFYSAHPMNMIWFTNITYACNALPKSKKHLANSNYFLASLIA